MDLGRIRERGRSTTSVGWITNPVRSMLWKLVVPFYEGFADEVEVDQKTVRYESISASVSASECDGRQSPPAARAHS